VFNGKGKCASCHVPPLFTEPGWNTHRAAEIGVDDFQAGHGAAGPGYYHDARFKDLAAVIDHYNAFFKLNVSAGERRDLIEYLKSL
jgi:cytochrome c peroxidase